MSTSETRPAPPSEPSPPTRVDEIPYVPRNFWAWVSYQFFYRIGWQFKMESTLMAGIISYLSPDPRVMGLFTAMNTLGRNLSPLMAAPAVDRFRHKRVALLLFWGATVAMWLALTLYLWMPYAADRTVGIWVFGACYTLFFIFLGATTVAQGALLGKIIPAGMRGRAMTVGMMLSGLINVGAILLIYQVLRSGRFPEPRSYALSFSLTAGLFILAGVAVLFVREEPSQTTARSFNVGANLRHFAALAREHPNLSRLMVVNAAVGIGGSMLQFYTAYWRLSGSMAPDALMMATLFQVFWQSLSSTIFGLVADSRGNRAVICGLLWIEAVIPLSAVVLGSWEPFRGHWGWYLGVYTLIGFRFPVFQLLVNYLLEIVPQREHAMALGAVNTVQLFTAAAPLLFGAVARAAGYPAAFVLGSVVLLFGAFTALGLEEVRVQNNKTKGG